MHIKNKLKPNHDWVLTENKEQIKKHCCFKKRTSIHRIIG